jgi:glycosyltransferase involved in cell wall biosynthesis
MPAMSDEPLVTIGIPVFQKERHLRATLDSALAQTHRNLEIVLADNGSTDASAAICREYAARDGRVRFVQNRHNLGSRRNFNLVFELAHGDCFVWGRGHDLWAPDFVARGVRILQQEPDTVLVHSRCRQIDVDGNELDGVAECIDTRGLHLPARLMAAWRDVIGPATLGIVRTAAMDRTRLYQDVGGCDVLFLLELAREGAFAFVDEPLLSLRCVRAETSEQETVRRTWAQLNPFRTRREPPEVHVLEYVGHHLDLVRELPVDSKTRDRLLEDLVAVYADKFRGSFTRALDALADRVQDAARDSDREPLDAATVVQCNTWLQQGLLFQPEHGRAAAARDVLLHFLLDLTPSPATVP